MVTGDVNSAHDNYSNNNKKLIKNSGFLNKTMTTVSGNSDLVVAIKQFDDRNSRDVIKNSKGFGKVEKVRGRDGKGDGTYSSLSSSSSASMKNGSGNGDGRNSRQSSSPNVRYYDNHEKQVRRLQSDGSISDEQSYRSSQGSKYNSNNNNNYYYKKNINSVDGRLSTTPKYCATSIAAALDNLKDDITYEKQLRVENGRRHIHLKTVSELVSLGAGFGCNNLKEQVFMEGRRGVFVPTTRSAALKNSDQTVWLEKVPELELQTSLDFAIIIQKIFDPISNICFGLLGGVALMQLFLSYMYYHHRDFNGGPFDFVESYNIFARFAPTAFYFLLAVCVVAVFDRFDLAHLDLRHCSDTLLYRHGWCLVIIYTITLIVTLCAAELDDMLLLYHFDKSFAANQKDMHERLSSWHALNMARCILALCGWIIVSLWQPENLLLHHLKSIKQFDVQQPKEILVVGSPSSANNDF